MPSERQRVAVLASCSALSSLVVACPVLSCLVVSILVVSYRVWAGRFPQLVTSLRKTFEKRLLHAGANTADIITQYISTIKALHELDPSGTTLRAISKPVQQYLRGRCVWLLELLHCQCGFVSKCRSTLRWEWLCETRVSSVGFFGCVRARV